MAKITITFESESALSDGPETITYSVDEVYAPDFVAAVAAHPKHGQIAEVVMADTGQTDADGKPILGPATQMRAASFREGLRSWSETNVHDVILGAVNGFRLEKARQQALASVNVAPIVAKPEK
jgi:hypothetical protein